MPFFIDEALGCLCMGRNAAQYDVLEEQPPQKFTDEKKRDPKTTNSLATDILSTLYAADTNDERLVQRVQNIVHETGWYEGLAAAVLDGLENALKAQAPMGQAMNDACGKARQVTADVLGFAREHPVFCALVALGILVLLVPWAIEILGFGELGPIAGSFAASWQSRYALGSVPKNSWFSFFQRLGMVWRRKSTAFPAIAI